MEWICGGDGKGTHWGTFQQSKGAWVIRINDDGMFYVESCAKYAKKSHSLCSLAEAKQWAENQENILNGTVKPIVPPKPDEVWGALAMRDTWRLIHTVYESTVRVYPFIKETAGTFSLTLEQWEEWKAIKNAVNITEILTKAKENTQEWVGIANKHRDTADRLAKCLSEAHSLVRKCDQTMQQIYEKGIHNMEQA
jgi:hypothetical protein